MSIKILLSSYMDTLFPITCPVCNLRLSNGEEFMCDDCLASIPETNYWLMPENPLKERLNNFSKINYAASLFSYSPKDNYSNLILCIKFKNQRKMATFLGRLIGYHIQMSLHMNNPDIIIPIPLHKSRKSWRGYNQSEYIAIGVGEVLGVPVSTDNVIRHKKGKIQSSISNSKERYENLSDSFTVLDSEQLDGKNILLIDDVITSGATVGNCAKAIASSAKNVNINVFSISDKK